MFLQDAEFLYVAGYLLPTLISCLLAFSPGYFCVSLITKG
jgi:hypothetical protein